MVALFGIRILLSLVLITWLCEAKEQPDEGRVPKPNDLDDKPKNRLARGWSDTIDWVELEAGIEIAKEE